MHVKPPKDWTELTKAEWEDFLKPINWKRDAYSGGIYYYHHPSGGRFGFESDDGRYYVDDRYVQSWRAVKSST